MKKVVVFGASGSVGKQSLEVLDQQRNLFEVVGVSVWNNNIELLNILEKYKTIRIVFWNNEDKKIVDKFNSIKFITTNIEELVSYGEIIINAVSGIAGLPITLESIEKDKKLLLANKESLVVAGALVNQKLKNSNATLIPIDSEHSAIFQCLEQSNKIEKILLTASGGPFLKMSLEDTKNVKYEDVFNHPTWNMGKEITVNSATMFNKCFEIIEAYHLFNTKNIETIVHPQSIIHSMVEFKDYSVKAQLSIPDMKQVILFALNFPIRVGINNIERIDFSKLLNLELKKIDETRFAPIKMAKQCLNSFNSKAISLNAANEVCVKYFINKKIKFHQITKIVSEVFESVENNKYNNINEIMNFDKYIRELTRKKIGELI